MQSKSELSFVLKRKSPICRREIGFEPTSALDTHAAERLTDTAVTCYQYKRALLPLNRLHKESEITSKEGLVQGAINEGYVPLSTALRQEYPERYPSVCGPGSIVLPRMEQVQSIGVPLQLGGPGERFELEIGIFNPDSSSPHRPGDHTYVRYYTGTGNVFYIDLVYRLLWGDKVPKPIIEKYREDEIDQALRERYSLFPFEEELARQLEIDLWGDGSRVPPVQMRTYYDTRAAMHDDRAFADTFVTDSGETKVCHKVWGQRTARVLKAAGQAP